MDLGLKMKRMKEMKYFSKYKILWTSINSGIEDASPKDQQKFSFFEDPFNYDSDIDYEDEYKALNKFAKEMN
jgi:hypothetical protein